MIKGVLAYVVIGIVFGSSLLAMSVVAGYTEDNWLALYPFCCGSRCSRTANRPYRYQERF